jgi:hypothetical protein
MVEGIVKLGSELERMAFSYLRVLDRRNVPIKLARPMSDTDA